MPSVVHEFDPPERFVAGAVGQPGARTFFLQARTGRRLVSVALEKQQVALLAERVDELLDEVMSLAASVVPAVAPLALDDTAPLDQPIEEEFRAGTMTLSWDGDDERVVIEVYPIAEDDGDEEAEPVEVLLIRIAPAAARAFANRALRVVEAGRPDCPFCGGPIDPDGHLCPRANGFRRRDP
ncbi:DUF3090 family protein [Nocardioides sp.]|uniref:DUF3090 family protein n=1 Tax=Nocardioides sp. TaxID=35761 RepID=UPI0039E64127